MRAVWAFGAVLVATASFAWVTAAATPSSDTDVTGCVIRFWASGPVVYTDGMHHCPFVTDVYVDSSGRLVVERDRGDAVQATMVNPDETLSSRGIIAGASWSQTRTTIRFYDTDTGPIRADDPELRGPTANVWITWVTTS